MREIKFRLIKDNKVVGYERSRLTKAKSRMITEHSRDNKLWAIILDGNGNSMTCRFIPHDDKEQFTGLHDKNGKEIYEGDILKKHLFEGLFSMVEVRWIKENNQWGYVPARPYNCGDLTKEYISNCEVIGNIHDNPELLENDK
jgi:hypothetical protein